MRGPLDYPSPPLTDGPLALRAWRLGDLDCVRSASLDPQIREGTTVPTDDGQAAAEAFIVRQLARADQGEGWSLAIALDDRAVGLVFLGRRPQAGVVGFGYWLLPAARGAGLATRAVSLASDWILGARGEHRLEAWVEPGNRASQQVLKRAGFTREGVLRSFLAFDDRRADAVVYSRVSADLDSLPDVAGAGCSP